MKTLLALALVYFIAVACGNVPNVTVAPTASAGNPATSPVAPATTTVIVSTTVPSPLPPVITPAKLPATAVPLPGGQGGIGFDDLTFDAGLGKVIVPGGRTGKLDLVDPATLAVTAIDGFTAQNQFEGGHGVGTTSADAGAGLLFAVDRNALKLQVVDPVKQVIVASAPLGSSPDYVRYVAATQELWVTEPDGERIEVFTLPKGANPVPARAAAITVSGGPESLVIDGTRHLAYTHLWSGKTVAVDLRSRVIRATWDNGCRDSRGIALDEPRGFLFAGCAEGKAVVLDVAHNGSQLSSLSFGSGVDVISYNPALAHLYLPGSTSANMAIIGVGANGALSLLGTADITSGAHCVVADNRDQAWVCDPTHGQLVLVKDTLPAAGH